MADFPKDLTGLRFGRWLAVAAAPPFPGESTRTFLCRCDCGGEKIVRRCSLVDGSSRSCGCLFREGHNNRKHSLSGSPTYYTWTTMKQRCYEPAHKSYKDYGGRGITVCDRWRQSFSAFLADMGVRPAHTTIERINNAGNYEPGNCRWATQSEQQNNRRSNHPITWRGETHNLGIWAAKMGLTPERLSQRIEYLRKGLPGWTLNECMTRPLKGYSTSHFSNSENRRRHLEAQNRQ